MTRPIVALLSDFGLRDSYVAQMKGVLLERVPEAQLVDVSHDVAPGDVLAGAWLLATAWRAFPLRTVFLAVVDPGVGTARRALALEHDGRLGVGPDNGLFTLVLDSARTVELTRRELWREPVSATFHGRDIFAPVAATLALGTPLDEVGAPLVSPARLPQATPTRREDGSITGHVIHIDRFGNLITDLPAELLPRDGFEVRVAGRVARVVRTYAESAPGELGALVNSAGHLEVALDGRSAASALGLERGATVEVRPR